MSKSVSRISLFFASILNRIAAWFVASPDDDDTPPTAPAAMLALPAPQIAGLLPAPSPKALAAYRLQQIHERNIERRRYMRRRRVSLRMEGRWYPGRQWAIALPAGAGEVVETGYRERTATIRMQERMAQMSGIQSSNPMDHHRALLAQRGIEVKGWVPGRGAEPLPTVIEETAQIAACEDEAQEGVIKVSKRVKLSDAQRSTMEHIAQYHPAAHGVPEQKNSTLRALYRRDLIAINSNQNMPSIKQWELTDTGKVALETAQRYASEYVGWMDDELNYEFILLNEQIKADEEMLAEPYEGYDYLIWAEMQAECRHELPELKRKVAEIQREFDLRDKGDYPDLPQFRATGGAA